ncbi:hypothetical protein ACJIZ3_017555 [Penstemon smallii]|uniref:Methionine gamma-lyase n=1 Tax=Penstemon smallii TaxID=265156 RepID=A0ABD3SX36_9LAMI
MTNTKPSIADVFRKALPARSSHDQIIAKFQSLIHQATHPVDPAEAMAKARHEFGEHGGVNMSIEVSSTFTVMKPETMRRMFDGELGPDHDFFIYGRHFNPTIMNLGRLIAALEGTESAYILHRLRHTLYGGTHALLGEFFPKKCNVTTTFVDIRDHDMVRKALEEGKTKVLYFESMSNPTLTIANVPELCKIAHDKGVMVVVDNTFAPMILSPARLGADVVVHSITKFISGGADIIAGAVCGPASLIKSMMDLHQGSMLLLGPTMAPTIAFEIMERLPHLGLRMKEHCHRAMVYATRMRNLGLKVIYPGLDDHPEHALINSTGYNEYGYGGLIALVMETEEKANRLMNLLQNYTKFGLMAVSLGSTSSELNEEEKELAGISPGLIRMSVGYNGTLEQKWSQFEKELSMMKA